MEDTNSAPSDDSVLTGALVDAPTAGIADDLALGALDADQARELTDTIKDAAEVLWMLIARAHAGRAWQSLGYSSWEKYVRAEFDMSRSRSYQILDQARVITAIESAVPAGAHITLSTAAAADIKGQLDTLVEEIKEATSGVSPAEAEEIVNEVVASKRESAPSVAPASRTAADALAAVTGSGVNSPEDDFADEDFEEYQPVRPAPSVLVASTSTPAPGIPSGNNDAARIRRNVNAAHDLYSSLSALAGLPEEIDEIVAIVPAERFDQIRTNLRLAVEKLARFQHLWESEHGTDAGKDEE